MLAGDWCSCMMHRPFGSLFVASCFVAAAEYVLQYQQGEA
jgi:hypothetical protein